MTACMTGVWEPTGRGAIAPSPAYTDILRNDFFWPFCRHAGFLLEPSSRLDL